VALRSKKRKPKRPHASGPARSVKQAGFLHFLRSPRRVYRLMIAARVLAPAVAGGALKASTDVRGALDEKRAKKLGVPVDEVARYRGPAGPVLARMTGLATAIDEVRGRRSGDPSVIRFSDSAIPRLADLEAAARATTTMPPPGRRATLDAINADLDVLDAELMALLVGPTAGTLGAGPSLREALPAEQRRELTAGT
jgi:hypothetical protein